MSAHVDDLPGCSQDPNERQYLLEALGEWVELSNKLVINKLLGMHIHIHDDGSAVMYNDTYKYALLSHLSLSDIKSKSTPGIARLKLMPNTLGEADPEIHARFRTIIGSGLFTATNWQMDTAYSFGRLSEHMRNSSFEKKMIWLLMYCAILSILPHTVLNIPLQ